MNSNGFFSDNEGRELEQMKNFQSQIESMTQESAQVDEAISTMTGQCQDVQNQMEVGLNLMKIIVIEMENLRSFLATSTSIRTVRKRSERDNTARQSSHFSSQSTG